MIFILFLLIFVGFIVYSIVIQNLILLIGVGFLGILILLSLSLLMILNKVLKFQNTTVTALNEIIVGLSS